MTLRAGYLAGLSILAGPAMAAPDESLMVAFDACFAAVTSGAKLDELTAYAMQPQQPDKFGTAVFLGTVATSLGAMPVKALLRDDVLFDCTMGKIDAEPKSVTFEAAEDSILAWFDLLDSGGQSERLVTSANHVASVFCLPEIDGLAVNVGATTLGSKRSGLDLVSPVPDELRFAVFLTHPDNFKECG